MKKTSTTTMAADRMKNPKKPCPSRPSVQTIRKKPSKRSSHKDDQEESDCVQTIRKKPPKRSSQTIRKKPSKLSSHKEPMAVCLCCEQWEALRDMADFGKDWAICLACFGGY